MWIEAVVIPAILIVGTSLIAALWQHLDLMIMVGVRFSLGKTGAGIEVVPVAMQSAPFYGGAFFAIGRYYGRWHFDFLWFRAFVQMLKTIEVSE